MAKVSAIIIFVAFLHSTRALPFLFSKGDDQPKQIIHVVHISHPQPPQEEKSSGLFGSLFSKDQGILPSFDLGNLLGGGDQNEVIHHLHTYDTGNQQFDHQGISSLLPTYGVPHQDVSLTYGVPHHEPGPIISTYGVPNHGSASILPTYGVPNKDHSPLTSLWGKGVKSSIDLSYFPSGKSAFGAPKPVYGLPKPTYGVPVYAPSIGYSYQPQEPKSMNFDILGSLSNAAKGVLNMLIVAIRSASDYATTSSQPEGPY